MTSPAPTHSRDSVGEESVGAVGGNAASQKLPLISPRRFESESDAAKTRAAVVLSTVGIWFASSMLVAWFEFGIFWNLPLLLFSMNLNAFDQLLVVGSLLARTLIVTSPMLAVLLIATKKQWHWKWKTIAWTAHFLVLAWIVIDCGLQCVTGANLWHYARKAMTTDDLAVGGDVSLLLAGIKSALSVIALQIAAIAIALKLVVHWFRNSRWQSRLPAASIVGMLLLVSLVPAVVTARHFVTQRSALEQLYGTITLRTWLFHPDRIAEYGEAAFGRECSLEFRNLEPDLAALFRSDVCRPTSSDRSNPPDSASSSPFVLTRSDRGTSDGGPGEGGTGDGSTGDGSAGRVTNIDRPNIVLLLTESFRHDALTKEHMPKLFEISKTGLVGKQHSTNSNCSEFGAFSAVYGRYALCYDDVLDQQVPSVPMHRLKQLAYSRQMVDSCSVNFSRMNEFLSDLNFDRISIHSEKGNPWHDNDRQTLNEISNIVKSADQPAFVFSILMATHYSYDYPKEYDQRSPNGRSEPPQDAASHQILEDRYWKSVWFLDEQISKLIDSVRGTNTIVIVTGDHGESFLDDGFLCHGTRLSKIQTQTPLLIVGPGIPTRQLSVPTGHVDLMPTILDLATGFPNHRQQNSPAPGRSVLRLPADDGAENGQNIDGNMASQLVVQARVNDWEIALRHPEGRLAFQTTRSGSELKIVGFLNESGRIEQNERRQSQEIPKWNDRLKAALTAASAGSAGSAPPAGSAGSNRSLRASGDISD